MSPSRRYKTPTILSDEPLRDEDRAHFHFDEFAVTLARLVASVETRTPLTIGVSGPWGAGKTTLLRRVKRLLDLNAGFRAKNEPGFRPCKTVWFDAWKYNDEAELLVALVRVLLTAMRNDGLISKIKAGLEDPQQPSYDIFAMLLNAFQVSFGGLGAEFRFQLDPQKHAQPSPFESHTAFFDHFDEAFSRLLALWVHGTPDFARIDEKKGALVIFIDDLDRCLPEKIIQVLEAVKLFLDKPGCVFLLGADTRLIGEAVRRYYRQAGLDEGAAGDYLEKLIQLRFELPPVQAKEMGEYLQSLPAADETLRRYWEVLVVGAEINPRKVKTFLNDLNLAWTMLLNSGQAQGVDRADFIRWRVLMRAAPENFRRKVLELDDPSIRWNFVRDALRWAGETSADEEERERLNRQFEPYATLRLQRVLRAIRAFGDSFDAKTLDAFLHLSAPPAAEEAPSPERRALAEGREAAKGAPRPKGVRVWGGLEFVRVPPGSFLMGSRGGDELAFSDERPQHTVEIPYEYWIGRFPVTNAQFAAFVEATGYVTTAEKRGGWNPEKAEFTKGFNWRHPLGPKSSIKGKEDHPVVQVSWRDAQAYVRWLNETYGHELPEGYAFRLPSEAEWEKAARGEYGNTWPWGDEWDAARCNSAEGGPGETTPVGAYSPQGDSPYGAADMAGNVWEWTRSLKRDYPYDPDDGREDESASGARVVRGGSFNSSRRSARAACRYWDGPVDRDLDQGFRVGVLPVSR